MSAWWDMGGNAIYVWPSVGVTLVVLALNLIWARQALRAAQLRARRRAGANQEGA